MPVTVQDHQKLQRTFHDFRKKMAFEVAELKECLTMIKDDQAKRFIETMISNMEKHIDNSGK